MANCSDTTPGISVQSPISLPVTSGLPWAEISFLTAWQEAKITSDKHGFSDYVYRIDATEGNLGVFYATEPLTNGQQIMWQVDQIRFHYPSEH